MTEESEQRESIALAEQVADEGNVPGQPSTSGVLVVAVCVLVGLALLYFTSTYMSSEPPRSIPQASRP